MKREFYVVFTARFPPSRAGASNYSVEQAEITIKLHFLRQIKLLKKTKMSLNSTKIFQIFYQDYLSKIKLY